MKTKILFIFLILFIKIGYAFELGIEVGSTEIKLDNEKKYVYNVSNLYFNHFVFFHKRNKIGFSGSYIYGSNPNNSYLKSYRSIEGNIVLVINLKSYLGTPEYFYLSHYVNPERFEIGRIDFYMSGGFSLNKIYTKVENISSEGYQSTVGINWFYVENLGIGVFYTYKWINKHPVKNIQYLSFNIIGEF